MQKLLSVLFILVIVGALADVKGTPGAKCDEATRAVCRQDGRLVHFSSHLHCLKRRRLALPHQCREYVDGAAKCLDEMIHLCPDMNEEQTAHCLEHHFDQLSDVCVRSLYMKHYHEEAGRPVDIYHNDYMQEIEELSLVYQEPSAPALEELIEGSDVEL